MALAGLVCLIGASLVRSFGTHVLHFYLSGVMHGFGIVFVGGTMAGTIIRRWFKENIGKYTGIVMSANGIGGAMAAQIVSPIINSGDVFGYRKAYLLSAVIAFVISLVVLFFLRDNPSEGPVIPGSSKKKQPKGALWVGLEYSVVKKKAYFYIATVLVFLTGISLQSIGSITIVYMTDLGLPTAFIATLATVSSLTLAACKMLVGMSYDRWGLRSTLLICQIAALYTFVIKGLLVNSTLGIVMAASATVISGIALTLETVMIPLIANDLFGSAAYMKVLGIFMAMNSLGLCLGSPLGEAFRKITGDYRSCFWFFSIVMVIVIVAFQFVLKAANEERNRILAETA